MAEPAVEPRRRRKKRDLPPPLPPETRTIGQLIAETIRLYGARWKISVLLGVGPAVTLLVASYTSSTAAQASLAALLGIVLALSWTAAATLAVPGRPAAATLLVAVLLSVAVWIPTLFLFRFFLVPGLVWLGFVGLSVHAAVAEGAGPVDAVRRGMALARADLLHALGSMIALGVLAYLMSAILTITIHSGSGEVVRISSFLAWLVVWPLLFLGGVLLYEDQRAREAVLARA